VRGNAGCFEGEMKDVIESVEVFDSLAAERFVLNAEHCEFGYRDSIFKRHPEWIILSAALHLKEGDPEAIREQIAHFAKERTLKQDIGTKSCGCIFKNIPWTRHDIQKKEVSNHLPELKKFKERPGIPASFLIDAADLKGRRAGSIVISPKHANFFINEGGGRAEDVRALVKIAKDAVQEKFGLALEEEIQYVGFFNEAI